MATIESETLTAEREKGNAALSSVVAAVALTTFKIVVGLLTGSLGILAEAAHSGLDLVAALVTFLAVRISGKPADAQHTYGHGKIENLSALFETLLLLVTCVWIIYEAIQRLFFHQVQVDVNIWAFLVMGVSIIIDKTRSRILSAAAKKHNSQALEADALHFSTDIWSSSVVILGLVVVKIGEWVPAWTFLRQADAVAAMGVACIVIYVSMQLGVRTIHGLLDTAPDGAIDKIQAAVNAVPGIYDGHNIRVRYGGPQIFVDVHVNVPNDYTFTQVHDLTTRVEEAIQAVLPMADVTVHPEPVQPAETVAE